MIRIFAGTFQQSKYLAERLRLKRSEWTYVSRSDVLQGLMPCNVLIYGTVQNRKDFREVMDLIEIRRLRPIYVPEHGPIPENVLKAIGRA